MPKFTVDGIDYNTEDLSENAKTQLSSLQFLEFQMRKIKDEITVYNTAKASYIAGLKAELEKSSAKVADAASANE
jgi:hypothetical protein